MSEVHLNETALLIMNAITDLGGDIEDGQNHDETRELLQSTIETCCHGGVINGCDFGIARNVVFDVAEKLADLDGGLNLDYGDMTKSGMLEWADAFREMSAHMKRWERSFRKEAKHNTY